MYVPATPWLGLGLVTMSVNALAGGLLMLAFAVGAAAILFTGLIRGAWRLPTAMRLMGDPQAWRGERLPYWDGERPRRS
jgi:hypothetical protein